MRQATSIIVTLGLAAALFAGCLGDDDSPKGSDGPSSSNAPDATPTAETGSVRGKVLTNNLEPVANAAVALVQDADIIATTASDAQGAFTFNGVAPGSYRVQVAAVCCESAIAAVDVVAGRVADVGLKLEPLTADDLQLPYAVPNEWEGFLSCAVAAGDPTVANPALAACGLPGAVHPSLADPNEDFFKVFNVSAGIRTLFVGMDWEPTGGVTGNDLLVAVENEGCNGLGCSYSYAEAVGPPPLVVRIDNDDITESAWTWDNVNASRQLQFRVFAAGTNAVYQQPFTVQWHAFYWQEAPADFVPLSDS